MACTYKDQALCLGSSATVLNKKDTDPTLMKLTTKDRGRL